MEGREIIDLILIINETIEEWRRNNKMRFVFKIDFEKVYDKVDWNFLDVALAPCIMNLAKLVVN